ncbi:MAG: pseudouridylate synthase [Myxococcales bacterium]|nr:pseudouridylate synthase [Myxococcales bacterium]
MLPLLILYQDDRYVAVDKPAGALVHRTTLAPADVPTGEIVLQRLRDQLRHHVYPIHRLDRATSGVLLFARDPEAARLACTQFETHTVYKRYLTVVRGYIADEGMIDYPLQAAPAEPFQSAITTFRRLGTVELAVPVGRYLSARYSLVEVVPKTGRIHQIRKHMHHIFHPIIGDTTHGEGRHNQLFRDHFNSKRLLLFATRLRFTHPFSGKSIVIDAPLDLPSQQLLTHLGWSDHCCPATLPSVNG